MWTQIRQPDLGPHCLPVCKNKFEKFARIFSRRHKQTTFSDAGFLGALMVNTISEDGRNMPLDVSFLIGNDLSKRVRGCHPQFLAVLKLRTVVPKVDSYFKQAQNRYSF